MQTSLDILSPDECQKLLHELLNPKRTQTHYASKLRNHLLCLLMLDSGVRVGELVKLSLTDLFCNGIPVHALLVRAEVAKRKHERSIPLTARLTDALIQTLKEAWFWRDPSIDEYAFKLGIADKHITTRRVQQIISDTSFIAIGRKIHPHVLRHTFATRLMQKTNIRVVQELLGHSSLTSTQIYTHPNNQDLKKAIDAI